MSVFQNVLVNKPWGYEYLVYESESVALWLLHIQEGKATSLHCHPQKTTGLVLLSGDAELGFITDSKKIHAPDKQMIRRGLFHSTKALSTGGVFLFEIETPNDKADLVRLRDSFGRESQGYETQSSFSERVPSMHWINNEIFYPETLFANEECNFLVEQISEIERLLELEDHEIIMFLRGGLAKTVDGRQHLATVPGDVGLASVIKRVAIEMDSILNDTLIIRITSNE